MPPECRTGPNVVYCPGTVKVIHVSLQRGGAGRGDIAAACGSWVLQHNQFNQFPQMSSQSRRFAIGHRSQIRMSKAH